MWLSLLDTCWNWFLRDNRFLWSLTWRLWLWCFLIVHKRVIDFYISENFVLFLELIQFSNLGVFGFFKAGVLRLAFLRPIYLLSLCYSLFCSLLIDVLRCTNLAVVICFILNIGVDFIVFRPRFDWLWQFTRLECIYFVVLDLIGHLFYLLKLFILQ